MTMQTIKPISISKTDRLPDMDFELLRQKGLDYLQKLTGQNWTDFNAHDPGITILEQLCYAITDLAYRIEYPMEDLLTNGYNSATAADENALYPLLQILTTSPVTINDFRRIIIDGIPEVDNAWIESISMVPGKRSLNGHYTVLLQTNKKTEGEIKRNPAIRDKIASKVTSLLNAERNLCEVFREVRILQPKEVMVNAKVQINAKANAEQVLAAIYNAVEAHLSGEVSFYTLPELLAKGIPLNQVISGPRLKNGFLLEEDMKPRPRQVSISTINKIIMGVEGVENVKNLNISEGLGTKGKDLLLLDEWEYPLLVSSYLDAKDSFSIQVFKENFEYPVNRQRVENDLRELRAVSHRNYKLSERSGDYLQVKKGTYQELDTYSSIQNDFPAVYMIDKQGMPASAPALRKAQANQLKGYLLFFEQILANYFVQLQSTGSFFSIDMEREARKTYFAQPIYFVPGMEKLMKGFEQKTIIQENRFQLQERWKQYVAENNNPYSKFLDEALEGNDEYLARKNRIFDHLLARFGEQIDEYSISSYRMYYGDETENPLVQSLKLKSEFLKQYPNLSYYRACAANIDATFGDPNSISGLERRVAMVLGFNATRRKLAVLPGSKQIKVSETKVPAKDKTETSVKWAEEALDIVLVDDLEKLDLKKDASPTNGFVFRGPRDLVVQETLYYGIDQKNYRIGPLKANGATQYAIVFKTPAARQWELVSLHDKPATAITALQKLMGFLTRQSAESEGCYLIEHTLLQHDLEEPRFGFSFVSRRGQPFLSNYKPMGYYARYEHAKSVLLHGGSRENYYMDRENTREFRIVIHNDKDEPIAKSAKLFPIANYGGQEAEREVKKMMRNIALLNEFPERSLAQMHLYTHIDDNDTIVLEDFYSFKATVVLPSWPARFQDSGFRSHLQNTFRKLGPAHIRLNFKWLSITEMENFEKVHEVWLKGKISSQGGKAQSNNSMINLLL